MIYIGFSKKTHKLYARILCKRFKHCAPVIVRNNKYYLYQFVNRDDIGIITLKRRDLLILQQYGWVFVKCKYKPNLKYTKNNKTLTCVQFTKQMCGITDKKIITPYDLFKYVK